MDAASLADSIIELSSRSLLIGKMMKEKNGNCVSLSEFEKLRTDLAEYKEKTSSLFEQLEEMKKQKSEQEVAKEDFKKEIVELKNESLRSSEENAQLRKENQLLNERVSALLSTNEADKSTIKLMDEEINQLRTNVFEAESFIFEQHQLGFEKALQQAKYFYKIPLDEGNFDVKKDFYKGELVPANEIPDTDAEDINIES
ncbi:golgin IMH1-like [Phaseolus vulgaris]|uniref:golgin IMH1-like n=1 Tax=Phaseolus vulgaris TaxID=3885 RepID=UPI0035CC7DAD